MKKIENVIESCMHCGHCQKYISEEGCGEVLFCGHNIQDRFSDQERLIEVVRDPSKNVDIPLWCPLETYGDSEQETEADPATPQTEPQTEDRGTLILPGLPHLEWMTENLQGFGGTEIDGITYYTYDQALEAVQQLGNGWRLPTRGEMLDLDELGSTWDDDRKGRWFGGRHDTDHAGSLFLPASGFRERSSGASTNVGSNGGYWSTSPAGSGSADAGYLYFYATSVHPLCSGSRAYGFTVRCVRNVQ